MDLNRVFFLFSVSRGWWGAKELSLSPHRRGGREGERWPHVIDANATVNKL